MRSAVAASGRAMEASARRPSTATPIPSRRDFADAAVRPAAASYNQDLGQFILPYDAVRQAPSPDDSLMDFLESTYDAAADLAQWDRAALERVDRHA